MDFLIATHNMKKQAELQRILAPLGINVLTADMAGIELSDVEETGTTFEENAFLKANSGCKESGMVCVADDSGLMVDFLDGAPGVYSARFGGEHGNDKQNRDLLLKIRQLIETFSTMNNTNNPKNEVFICLTAGEEMELSDCLKTVVNYDTNNTPLVIEKLKAYYTKIQTQISKIVLIIDRVLGQIEQ